MSKIILHSINDVTDSVKQDLLNNNVSELVINFNLSKYSYYGNVVNPIFDVNQETINFKVTINASEIYGLFCNLPNLKQITELSSTQVIVAEALFYGCSSLKTISKIDFPHLVNANNIFCRCKSLTKIPDLSFIYLLDASEMFGSCEKLTKVPNLCFPNLRDASEMFMDCHSLTKIPDLDFPKVKNAWGMFWDCTKLKNIPNVNFPLLEHGHMFCYRCIGLKSIPDLNFPNIRDTREMFKGCENVKSIGTLNFGDSVGNLTMFASSASGYSGSGDIPYLHNPYLKKEQNNYPSWFFPSSIVNSQFDFSIAVNELFKYMLSYRGFGVINDYKFRHMHLDMNKFAYIYDRKAYKSDINGCFLLRLELHGCDIFHGCVWYGKAAEEFVKVGVKKDYIPRIASIIERDNVFDKFDIEITNEEKFIKHGSIDPKELIIKGKFLLDKYASKTKLANAIKLVIEQLEANNIYQDSSFGSIYQGPSSTSISSNDILNDLDAQNIISALRRKLDIGDPNSLNKYLEDDEDKDSSKYRKRRSGYSSYESNTSNTESTNIPKNIPKYPIDGSIFDKFPKDLPEDVTSWLNDVKKVKRLVPALGHFELCSSPLKIVIHLDTIKKCAQKNNLSLFLLVETVLAHELFHMVNFVFNSYRLLDNRRLMQSISHNIFVANKYSEQEISKKFWEFIHHATILYWKSGSTNRIVDQVVEPLAVAFEIAWIKDRIITQEKEREQWKDILNYELKRFSGINSYPSDPYCGAKYLVTSKENRKKLADMTTIIRNIKNLLLKTNSSISDAYDYITKELM